MSFEDILKKLLDATHKGVAEELLKRQNKEASELLEHCQEMDEAKI